MQLEGRLASADRSSVEGVCPMERAMAVVGTRSAIVLMREASYGTRRFDDFVRRTGLTEAVAAGRLKELVAEGLLEKQPYREPGSRTRQAYVLTEAGHDLLPILIALGVWGGKHRPQARTAKFVHEGCGEPVTAALSCGHGHSVSEAEIAVSI